MAASAARDRGFHKEVFTGVPGRYRWYRGDAHEGLDIELAPGDVLRVTPEQIQAIVAELGSLNYLLLDCLGLHLRPITREELRQEALDKRARKKDRSARGSRANDFATGCSGRFSQWLHDNAAKVFGQTLNDKHAICIQSAFAGEGLLPMEGGAPGDFPTASVLASGRALAGHRVIYEEGRRFLAVDRKALSFYPDDEDKYCMTLRNLNIPGFSTAFPGEFPVSGSVEETSVGIGMLGGYMNSWCLITSPRAVGHILEVAPGLYPKSLLQECRRVAYGHI